MAEEQKPAYMTIAEMGRLLGLKRTGQYWLINRGLFETSCIGGKTMIDVGSFEKWYAGQLHYRKVDGVKPGGSLDEDSYSIHDISEMIGISESSVYALIKREHIRTETIDFRMRVPKEEFKTWYSGQTRYRTKEDRKEPHSQNHETITIPQMAALLGIPVKKAWSIVTGKKYRRYFKNTVPDGQGLVTRNDFESLLSGQKIYQPVDIVRMTDLPEEFFAIDSSVPGAERHEKPSRKKQLSKKQAAASESSVAEIPATKYTTPTQASLIAGISRQAVLKAAGQGHFTCVKVGCNVRILTQEFVKWAARRDSCHMKHTENTG